MAQLTVADANTVFDEKAVYNRSGEFMGLIFTSPESKEATPLYKYNDFWPKVLDIGLEPHARLLEEGHVLFDVSVKGPLVKPPGWTFDLVTGEMDLPGPKAFPIFLIEMENDDEEDDRTGGKIDSNSLHMSKQVILVPVEMTTRSLATANNAGILACWENQKKEIIELAENMDSLNVEDIKTGIVVAMFHMDDVMLATDDEENLHVVPLGK